MHKMNFSIESNAIVEQSRFPWLAALALALASFLIFWVVLGWV